MKSHKISASWSKWFLNDHYEFVDLGLRTILPAGSRVLKISLQSWIKATFIHWVYRPAFEIDCLIAQCLVFIILYQFFWTIYLLRQEVFKYFNVWPRDAICEFQQHPLSSVNISVARLKITSRDLVFGGDLVGT